MSTLVREYTSHRVGAQLPPPLQTTAPVCFNVNSIRSARHCLDFPTYRQASLVLLAPALTNGRVKKKSTKQNAKMQSNLIAGRAVKPQGGLGMVREGMMLPDSKSHLMIILLTAPPQYAQPHLPLPSILPVPVHQRLLG
jgi:hypothetical protein